MTGWTRLRALLCRLRYWWRVRRLQGPGQYRDHLRAFAAVHPPTLALPAVKAPKATRGDVGPWRRSRRSA